MPEGSSSATPAFKEVAPCQLAAMELFKIIGLFLAFHLQSDTTAVFAFKKKFLTDEVILSVSSRELGFHSSEKAANGSRRMDSREPAKLIEDSPATSISPAANRTTILERLGYLVQNLTTFGASSSLARKLQRADVSSACTLGLLKVIRGLRNMEPWVFRREYEHRSRSNNVSNAVQFEVTGVIIEK